MFARKISVRLKPNTLAEFDQTFEHQRNYAACLEGYGYCDRSALTTEEQKTILRKH
ncbi:MAG TPA: hypothetical protein VI685_09530 [Candidatus Angelobacter sp.]